MNVGGGHRCPRCEGRVYFAEEVIAIGRHWHKTCFLCANAECKKRLDSSSCAEHEGEAYCGHCHRRFFGPKGYGFGLGSGTLSMDDGQGHGAPADAAPKAAAQPLRPSNASAGSLFRRSAAGTLSLPGGGDKCGRCAKTVYQAEKVSAAGRSWHRVGCFTCGQCSSSLRPGQLCERDGDIFCKACYGRSFGPKGYGYGVGAGTLQSEAQPEPTH